MTGLSQKKTKRDATRESWGFDFKEREIERERA